MSTFKSLQLDRVALRFGGFKALDDEFTNEVRRFLIGREIIGA